jgi:murein DD-endopeptidase MepM/ murein hydrolase activator NlpD
VSGKIIRGYKKGANGNDGIDISAPVGTNVKAAEDGEVALISKGADDKAILLIRHADNLYTVYSNIANVGLKKGQKVSRGQKIGGVANSADGNPYLHFEIRRGTESVDPAPFL